MFLERCGNFADRTVTLLADNNFRDAGGVHRLATDHCFFEAVRLGAINKHDDVRILLKTAAFTQI